MGRNRKSDFGLVGSAAGASAAPARQPTAISRKKNDLDSAGTARPSGVSGEAPGLTTPPAVPASYDPAQQEIAALAYSYWEARGCQGGCPEQDWLRAERELRERTASLVA